MKCDLLIKNCSVLTPEMQVFENYSIAINQTDIIAIGKAEKLEKIYEPTEILHGDGRIAMPGFIDGHTHTCQQLLRGRTHEEWPMVWTRFLVPFESNLTPEDSYYSALLSCLEMIKSGTTGFAESGGVHMERVADAVLESGMRAAIARSTMDIGSFISGQMKDSAQGCIEQTERLFRDYNGAGEDRIRIWFGMRQVMTCSPELIAMTAERSKELHTGVHAHLCEHKDEVRFCLENYHKRPAEFLYDIGLLAPNLLTAHNVVLSEHDISLMSERDVKVVHCPSSNLSNHGFSKTPRLMEEGMSIGLGSDGASSTCLSLFDQMKFLRYAMIAAWGLPIFDPMVMPCKELLKMATYGGACALQRQNELGTLEVGKKADIILLKVNQPHLVPTYNLVNTIVTAASEHDVTDSVINGKIVMKDRNVLTLDEEKIIAECAIRQKEIFKRANI